MQLQEPKILKNISFPVTVHLYESVDSTNNEAKRRAAADSGFHLYATMHQTAGRGRRGHSFYSPKGTGLYMTLSLPLADTPASVQKITCAAGAAVCEAVETLSDNRPRIKWVNDIFVNGKKSAGILTELVSDCSNRPHAVIVGIGLNLNTAAFPEEFAEKAGNFGMMDVNELCGRITEILINMYMSGDYHSVIEKYKRLNLCIGRTVTYAKDGCEHTAKAVDINSDGGLVVEENDRRVVLNSGEISVKL